MTDAWQLRGEAYRYLNLELFGSVAGEPNPFDLYDGPTRHEALALIRERGLYRLYLRSNAWRSRRRAVIARAGGACEDCGRSFLVVLDAHHLTYERIGDEDLEDLKALCRPCHDEAHAELELELEMLA